MGLFTLQNLEAEEELIPFTGPYHTTNQYNKMQGYFPRVKCYALNAEKTFYIDGDVEKGMLQAISIVLLIDVRRLRMSFGNIMMWILDHGTNKNGNM